MTLPVPGRGRLAPVRNRVTVIQGGTAAILCHNAAIWRPNTILVLDVKTELDRHLAAIQDFHHSHVLVLAEGETSDSLFDNRNDATAGFIAQLARMAAMSGLGMFRGIGAQATRQIIDTDYYRMIRESIADDLLIACEGRPTSIEIISVAGICGATGSGGLAIITEDLASFIFDQLCLPVHVEYHLVGAISFLGLGSRIQKNAAAATLDFAATVVRKDKCPYITRSAHFVELPPCRDNQEARDSFVSLDQQAIAASGVREHTLMLAPNLSLDSRFGNLRLRQVDFHRPLSPDAVCDEVARALRADLDASFGHLPHDSSLVRQIEFTQHVAESPRCDLDELASAPARDTFKTFLEDVTAPHPYYTYDATLTLPSGQQLDLDKADCYWALPPATPKDARERLMLQNAILAELESQAEETELDIIDKTKALTNSIKRLKRRWKAASGRGLVVWRTATSLRARLAEACPPVRLLADQLAALQTRSRRIKHVYGRVHHERCLLGDRVQAILTVLDDHLAKSVKKEHPPHLETCPASQMWPELWTTPALSKERQEKLLFAAVSGVTVAGLADIVNVSPARLNDIAAHAYAGPFATNAPPWGGCPRKHPCDTVVVFPPVEAAVATQLRSLIEGAHPHVTVAFADTCIAGVTVTRQRFFAVNSARQLVTGYLPNSLLQVLTAKESLLFVLGGKAALDELGIQLDQDRLVFEDPW